MKTEYDKQTQELNSQLEDAKKELEDTKNNAVAIITSYQDEADLIYEGLVKICEASANKKVREVGETYLVKVGEIRDDLKIRFNAIVNSSAELMLKTKEEIINSVV